jgi:N-acetylneuraminic acid mutarotase
MKHFLCHLLPFALVLLVASATARLFSSAGAALAVQWSKKCNMPGALYAFDAATLGDKIYAIGGRGKEERHDRYTYVYDPAKDSWEIKNKPLFPRSNHAVAALGNKIYVFGGNDSAGKAEAYDVDADNWKELAPIPSPRMHINYSAAVCNGKIFLIGGLEKKGGPYYDTDSNKNEMYDPVNNTWTEKAPLPSPRQTAAITAFENKIYVISGKFKYDDRNDVFAYDPETDTWQTKAPMPETRFISGVAVVKDKIVVMTGVDGRSCRESKIFAYEPLKDRWHDLGKVPRNFMLAGVTSIGDKFYILGGSDLENILFQCLEGTLLSQSEAQNQDRI